MAARIRLSVAWNRLAIALLQVAIVPLSAGAADRAPGPIVLRVPGMSDVRVKRDLQYQTTGDGDLRFDAYLPKSAAPPSGWPVVLLIHGGPVPPKTPVKDWPLFESYGRVIAAHDLAAITFNYRFGSSDELATGATDIKELLETLERQAGDLGIDARRIGLWAFSGGGPQLGIVPREHPENVRCLISFYALLDAAPEQQRYSPLALLKASERKMPPMFIARAGKDFLEFNRSVDAFVELARKRDLPVTVENYADGVHGFDFLSDTDESRRIIGQAVAFAKQHLDGAPPAESSGELKIGSGTIYYELRGAGPAIVLLHDGLLHREAWEAQWQPLSNHHRLVRYDRRGYGRSSTPSEPYSDVEDLQRLLAHLQIDRGTIIGSSAGGNLALQFALAHPDHVERLVLVGAVVSGLGYSAHFQSRNRAAFAPLAERRNVQQTIENWVNDRHLTAANNNAAKERLRELLAANPQNLTRPDGFQRSGAPPALPRLAEIKVPTLIITGDADIPDVHAHCGAIQAGIAGSTRIVVKDAGHLVYIERPDEFNRIVSEFVSQP